MNFKIGELVVYKEEVIAAFAKMSKFKTLNNPKQVIRINQAKATMEIRVNKNLVSTVKINHYRLANENEKEMFELERFKVGDIIKMSEIGEHYLLENSSNRDKQKNTLVRVTEELKPGLIYIERMDGQKINNIFPTEYFRLATSNELKMYELKNVFSKEKHQ